jgi:hypothetical protein
VIAGKSISQLLTDSPIAHDILLTSANHVGLVTSIVVDNTQTVIGSGTSVTLPSFTVSNGPNRYLLVAVETNGTVVSGVTYGAQSLSLLRSGDFLQLGTEIWGVVNPTSGTGNVVVSFSPHTAIAIVGAYNILGVDQTNPIPTTAHGTSGVGGGSPSVFITNQYNSSLVIDSAVKQAQTISTTTPQEQTWNLQSGSVTGGSSTILPSASVSNHFLWTPGATLGRWNEVAVEVKASGLITPLEIIHVSDTLTTASAKSKTLSETITVSDNTASASGGRSRTLTETVTASDTLSTVGIKHATLTETVTASDYQPGGSGGRSRMLFTETVTVHDSLSTAASRKTTLTETVTASDLISSGLTKNLTLAETITSHDTISFKGGINIQARDQNNILIPGAIYSLSPNPNGSNTPEVIVDGGSNDNDAPNNDGIAVVTLVPFGPYNITMTKIPTGYNVLGNSTLYTVYNTNLNGTAIFRLTPIHYNLNTLPPIVITSAPNLNATTLGMWSPSGFNAIKINGTVQTPITKVQSLPPIISVGSTNSGLNTAVTNQVTVSLQTSFTDNTTPTTIIRALGVPVYSMPQSSNVTAVLPSIVGTASTTSTNQVITTPPLNQIIPGQKMIIPVVTLAIPQTGGLKQLNVTACTNPGQNGCAAYTPSSSNDWFVVKTDNKLPASKPVLPLNDKLTLYINVTYQHEVTGTGFDWSNPANFKTPPQLTLQLPKNAPGVELDSNKCPISDIFLFDPTGNGGAGSWITNPVTILSSTPSTDNSLTCDVVVSAPHFSQFALGGHSVSSTTPGSTVSAPG